MIQEYVERQVLPMLLFIWVLLSKPFEDLIILDEYFLAHQLHKIGTSEVGKYWENN